MGYKVVITGPAVRDLSDIVTYIADDNVAVARKTGHRLIDKAETLAEFPFVGSKSRDLGMEDCRVLVSAPYWIVYRVSEERKSVEIFRFWHPARGKPVINRDEF
jgi:plasmid stabilization system protein ParE